MKRTAKLPTKPQDKLDLAARILFRKATLVDTYGTPEEQKNELVEFVLGAFCLPDRWPLTDSERCLFLRSLYEKAVRIRETQNAINVT